ncbi:MAG: Ig-like domain repeat protein [Chloroflexi bacterium]|nr:Ig-like domain repeat protein [Chloroflexota bacterium]
MKCLQVQDVPTPTVVTEIHNAGDTVVTSVVVGTTVHDKATVSGGFGTPTGSVTFDWFTNGTCTGAPAATSGAFALAGGSVDATTFTQTPSTATPHSFQAHYSGDGVYSAADSPCEPLTVTKPDPHYECYDIVDSPPGVAVTLETQFGVDEVDVGPALFLCPPTLKNGEGDLTAQHLKCYDIFGSDPPDLVDLTTQFGLDQQVEVGQARLLCVPALKQVVFPISDLPLLGPLPTVPHYECYDIDGPAPDISVTLDNQFGVGTVNVGPARFLCAPAIKTVIGSGLPGEGDLAAPHLKCYDILAASPAFIVDLETQFGIETSVNVEQAKLLCVLPAVKVVVCLDSDGDGWCDFEDNCPAVATVWFVPVGDTDCDGFPSSVGVPGKGAETDIGTDPNNPCAANNVANNEGLPDHWPFDFNDNQRADLSDVLGYIPVFNSFAPGPPYDPRFDLDFSGGITLGDVLSYIPVFNLTC